MSVKQSQRVTVPITVILRGQTVDRYSTSGSGVSVAELIGVRAMQAIEALEDGGVLLTVDQVRAIEEAIKRPIRNSKDVVAAAQKAEGVEDGKHVFRFTIDPEFVPPLEEISMAAGRPVKDLIQETVDLAIENQWTYNISFEGRRRTFGPADEAFFAEAIGSQDFTVAELRDYVKGLRRRKDAKTEESAA